MAEGTSPGVWPTTRYCLVFLGCVIAMLAAVISINAVMDPLGMFGTATMDRVNTYKPAIHNRVRLYKAYEIARVRPQVIILGSSRTHVGIRCSHPALKDLPGPCYNLAFDGATTREMYAYLNHAQAVRPLKVVILGLDTYHLSSAASTVRPDFDPGILLESNHDGFQRVLADLRLLVSMTTLRASVDLWRQRSDPEPEWFAPDGQRLGEVFFRREGGDFVRGGPRAYFDAIDRLEVGFQTDVIPRSAAPRALTVQGFGDETSMGYIGRIVAFCRANAIDLRIFITPSHVHQLEIAAATGAFPSIAHGKRDLARLLADDAARYPMQRPIPAWDFSGYSTITEEPLPPMGSRREMQYYWDSSHFKFVVGDYVLDRMFLDNRDDFLVPVDFGAPIDIASIDSMLEEQARRQASYRERFGPDVAELRSLVADSIVEESRTAKER